MTEYSDSWRPKGIDTLEPVAWDALKYPNSAIVNAGPGAGKTEFLAQKAAYQLETGECFSPYRILAISFKKDAAENLASRVKKRCKPEYSARFDSYTFDAFTKGIVDRFNKTLPEKWRLPDNYEIDVDIKDSKYEDFLAYVKNKNPNRQNDIAAVSVRKFRNQVLALHKLSVESPTSVEEGLARAWFTYLLKSGKPDFQLLNRLAELIIRKTPAIKRAIQQTYPMVYVDEFQDTTSLQYDFLHSLFDGSPTKITVVGDDKQRIMAWAGAKIDAFEQFMEDFSASKFSLLMNHRSSPGLVAIQQHVALSLDPECCKVQSGVVSTLSADYAQIWGFQNARSSYEHIASWIISDMKKRGLAPSDYSILVRQSADGFHKAMSPEFAAKGLLLRNEAQKHGVYTVSDIVSDPLFLLTSAIFRLIIQEKSPSAWTTASKVLKSLFDDDEQSRHLESLLMGAPKLGTITTPGSVTEISLMINHIMAFIGTERLRGAFTNHSHGDNLQIFLDSLHKYFLFNLNGTRDWNHFLALIDGEGQIPLQTIHKSKGQEYDTVILVALDDAAWWTYSPENPEGNATFFVALSRAKQRIIITHANGTNRHEKVGPLYELLKQAGVNEKSLQYKII